VRRFLSLLLASAVCAVAAAPACATPRLAVYVDHAAKLQVPGPIGSVIVGDPSVADVMVVDRHTIFVQGKGYGQTEIVLVDGEGRTVWQGDVAVVAPDQGRVSVVRGPAPGVQGGAQVTEMTCAGYCSPSAHAGKSTTASAAPSLNIK
jgi:Flp pilus assembly secretin CpaC